MTESHLCPPTLIEHPVHDLTPFGLALFSKRLNEQWVANGSSNNLLALQLGVDFEVREMRAMPGHGWFQEHPAEDVDMAELEAAAVTHTNMIAAMSFMLDVIKS